MANWIASEKRWEDEITKDLQEFEVVGAGGSDEVCDEDLEKDLAAMSWSHLFITSSLTTVQVCD